jgi:PilZ domain
MTALRGWTPTVVSAEQRAAERFPVNAGTTCPFAGAVAEEVGPVRVVNVSMDGVGLRLARRVEPGALLAVGLSNPAKGFAKTVVVRVAHAEPEPGGCLVGGTFLTPLSYQELTALVM